MFLLQACWAELFLLLLCQSCQLEEAAKDLEEAVKCESITEAALGGQINFSCNFLLSMDVLQVTWQKISGSSFQNIATFSKAHGPRLIGSFQKKARFIRARLYTSAITLQNLTSEDMSCYRCIFNVFPHGAFSSKDLCLNIQNSGNTNKPGIKMLDLDSPSTRGTQRRIGLVAVSIYVTLAVLILLITWLFNRKRRKLQEHRALSTPAKEKGLQQDASEQLKSLHTPKNQDTAYQNEKQTPGTSLCKRQMHQRRKMEENKGRESSNIFKRLTYSKGADSLDNTVYKPQRELTELHSNELGCTPMKNTETEPCGECELCPATAALCPSTEEQSAHQSPVSTSPEEH
ncbi:OX2G protein, partial [Odontophorus gujanensis]|nr:OX2G protein [Odontophorus gujanensis]